MKYDIQAYVLKLNREYHKRIKWYRLLAVLSCITVFLTIYLLIMPGITQTDEYYGDFESSDLSRFTTGVSIKDIDGNEIDLSNGTVFVGETYIFEVAFAETNDIGNNHQFKYDDSYSPPALTYRFDAANLSINQQMSHPITIQQDGETVTVGHFDVDRDGFIKAYFDNVTNTGEPTPDGTNFIDLYREVNFNLKFSVKVDGGSGDKPISIDLGKNIVVELVNSPHGDLAIDKKMLTYDESTHTLKYKVVIECTHGEVSDLHCVDDERIRDNKTGLINGVPLSSYRNLEIRDLEGNYVGSDYSFLPGTLSRGEGYEITYDIPLDRDWYDSAAMLSGTSMNDFTVDATDSAGEPLNKKASTNNPFNIINFSKTAYQSGVDGTDKILHWTLYAGDGENPLPNNTIVTDIVNQEQEFYTDILATWTILEPKGITPSGGSFTYGGDFVIDGQHATIDLPPGGAKYKVDYYTTCKGGRTYTNEAAINYNGWTASGSHTVVEGECIIDKEITSVDGDYIEYHIEATVPKERYNTVVWFRDRSFDTRGNQGNPDFVFNPIDLVVTATDETTNITTTVNPYTDGSGSEITYWTCPSTSSHKDYTFVFTDKPMPNNGSGWIEANTKWPYQNDTRIDITYKLKRDETYNTSGMTINDSLAAGMPVTNAICALSSGGQWQYASAPYSELPGVTKKGVSSGDRDATFQYRVAFTNNKSNPASANYWDKLSLLPEEFEDMHLHDTFDPRLHLVNGSLYALVYERDQRQEHDLGTTLGEGAGMTGLYRAILEYTGPEITGNVIDAKWTDFTASFCTDYGTPKTNARNKILPQSNGDIITSADWGSHTKTVHNLEEIMQYAPEELGVVFVYKTQLDDEYRVLSGAEMTMEFDNTAYVSYDTPLGTYETNRGKSHVTYDTKLLDKTFQTFSGSDVVRYTIVLNEYGVDLTDGDYIVIEDTMGESLTLYLETVKIQVGAYDSGGNLVWSDYSGNPRVALDEISNTMALTLPDDCPVKVVYDCKVSGERGQQVSLENSVVISGREAEIKTNNAVFEMSGSGGSGSAQDFYMYILKKDIRTNMYLTGASFDLYGNNITRSTNPSKTITANGETLYYYATFETQNNSNPVLNGTFRIDHTWLENNGHFAVIETVPPEGYELSTQVLDFYWNGRPNGGNENVPIYENRMTYTYNDYPLTPELPATGSFAAVVLKAVALLCAVISVSCLICLVFLQTRKYKRKKQVSFYLGERRGNRDG